MSGPVRATGGLGLIALIVVAVLAIAGCGGGGDSESAGANSANSAEAASGGVLRFGLESPPTTLNPSRVIQASALIPVLQVGEGLYEIGPDGKPVPNLATGVKASPDGLTQTFTLKEGVSFSDGTPVTSKDVVFTLEQAQSSPYFASLYETISKISAPAPNTVVVKLKSPTPALLAALGFYATFVIPDGFGGRSEKEFAQAPVGTGPYVVASSQRGQAITLTPNANYWKPEGPKFEEIVFTPVTEENARLQQIRGGDLDMTKATPISVKTGIPAGSGIRVEETTQNIVDYLLLNQGNPLFEDQRVREAVNLAVDREGIVETATDGKGEPAASFLPPANTFSINPEPPERDVAKAKELLAEASRDGVDTSASITLNSYNFDAYSGFATQIIQQNLEEIGLNVKLQPLDEAALNELLETGDYDAVQGLYLPALSDPSEIAGFYLGFFAPGAGQDVAALTRKNEEATVETDEAKRAELYAELQQMLIDEEGLLVLNYQPVVYPVIDTVTGIEFDPVGDLLLRNAGFAK